MMQDKVREFVAKHNLKTTPEIRLLDAVSEMGEVAKELIKMTDYGKNPPTYRKEIEEELGDLLFSILCLANHYDIIIDRALDKVLAKYEERLT
jgi:NTP pyrophosphatase (non-canonical NTP hydrolase)